MEECRTAWDIFKDEEMGKMQSKSSQRTLKNPKLKLFGLPSYSTFTAVLDHCGVVAMQHEIEYFTIILRMKRG